MAWNSSSEAESRESRIQSRSSSRLEKITEVASHLQAEILEQAQDLAETGIDRRLAAADDDHRAQPPLRHQGQRVLEQRVVVGDPGVEDLQVDAVVAEEVAGRGQVEVDRQRRAAGRRRRRRRRIAAPPRRLPEHVLAQMVDHRGLAQLAGEVVER
jgi:hypothetical protein